MRNDHIRVPSGFRAPHVLAQLDCATPVAVALSGGADSVALLHILATQKNAPVLAVHVHHGLRGREADRDAAFCETLCASLGVPLTVLRLNVKDVAAQTGESIETAARNARYEALRAYLDERGIRLLATAHHADDQLETMLQHLLRGAGLRGLCGIPAARPLGNATVVRPLLLLSKEEVLAYCREADLDFVTDSTNAEPCCTRNRLRLEVLPVLAELWPSGTSCAARCADSLTEDQAFLASLADDFIRTHGKEPPCAALAALPAPIFARVMHALLPAPPETAHVRALSALVREARPHASLSLPGATVRVESERFTVQTTPSPAYAPYDVPLSMGETPLPFGVAVLTRDTDAANAALAAAYPFFAKLRFRADAATGTLTLRPRRAGERMVSGGNHKLLRKLPCMARYPLELRARLPLLCDDDGVLAVPGGPVRDGAKENADTTLLLFFR